MFGDLVKAVVDVDQGIMAVGGEMQADEEALLLDEGSAQPSDTMTMHAGLASGRWWELTLAEQLRTPAPTSAVQSGPGRKATRAASTWLWIARWNCST